jgi:hypothetical protein
MNFWKRFKTSHNSQPSNQPVEASINVASVASRQEAKEMEGALAQDGPHGIADVPQNLCEPNTTSHLLSFCDFSSLLALRSVNKAWRSSVNKKCVHQALASLPLACHYYLDAGHIGFITRMEVCRGWKDRRRTDAEDLADMALEEKFIHDERGKRKAKEILLRTGHVDTKDMKEGSDVMQFKHYVQRPYAVYSKYCEREDGRGWGAAIIIEDSISVERALMLVEKMLWSLTDAEAMGLERDSGFNLREEEEGDDVEFCSSHEDESDDEADDNALVWDKSHQTDIPSIGQHLLCLLVMAHVSSVRHSYMTYQDRGSYQPVRGRDGTLSFMSDGHKIEVTFKS